MRLGIGVGEVIELAGERERIGEIVAAQGTDLDPVRARRREAADRAVRVAEAHRPVKSGVRFSRKAAMPSFWSSLANSR